MLVTMAGYRQLIRTSDGTKNLFNHRHVGAALIAYSAEHKGNLPWSHDANPDFSSNGAYYPKTLMIFGYLSNPLIFVGPVQWRKMDATWRKAWQTAASNPAKLHSTNPWAHTTYAANRYGAMPSSGDGRHPANLIRVGNDGNLSKLMLLRDVYNPRWDSSPNDLRGGGHTQFVRLDDSLPLEEDTFRGLVHATFADGHVEAIEWKKLKETTGQITTEPLFFNKYTRK